MEEEKISIENDTAEEQIIDVQPPEEQKKKGKKRITDEHREKLKLNIKKAQEARGKYKKNEKIITNDILDLMLLFSS